MGEEKRRFKTIIGGKTYTIVGTKPHDHLRTVSELVNKHLSLIQETSTNLSLEQSAILVAVNAVSEQILKQQEVYGLEQQLAELKKTAASLQENISRLQKENQADQDRLAEAEKLNEILNHELEIASAQLRMTTADAPQTQQKAAPSAGSYSSQFPKVKLDRRPFARGVNPSAGGTKENPVHNHQTVMTGKVEEHRERDIPPFAKNKKAQSE